MDLAKIPTRTSWEKLHGIEKRKKRKRKKREKKKKKTINKDNEMVDSPIAQIKR